MATYFLCRLKGLLLCAANASSTPGLASLEHIAGAREVWRLRKSRVCRSHLQVHGTLLSACSVLFCCNTDLLKLPSPFMLCSLVLQSAQLHDKELVGQPCKARTIRAWVPWINKLQGEKLLLTDVLHLLMKAVCPGHPCVSQLQRD